MKNIQKILIGTLAALSLVALPNLYVLAQQSVTDTLPESAYSFQVPKHIVNIYSNFVPFVLFGIIAIGMAYIIYRYWHDNRPSHHDFTHHNFEH